MGCSDYWWIYWFWDDGSIKYILRIQYTLRSWIIPFAIWIGSAENLLEKYLFGQKKKKRNECAGGGTIRLIYAKICLLFKFDGSGNAKGEARSKQINSSAPFSQLKYLVAYLRRCVPSHGDLIKFAIATLFFFFALVSFCQCSLSGPLCRWLPRSIIILFLGRTKIYIWSQNMLIWSTRTRVPRDRR